MCIYPQLEKGPQQMNYLLLLEKHRKVFFLITVSILMFSVGKHELDATHRQVEISIECFFLEMS